MDHRLNKPTRSRMAKSNRDAIRQDDLLGLTGYNMKRAYMRIYRDLETTLAPLNLRQRTFSVLSLVQQNPGISQSDVARSLGIERSGTVVIVDELETRELIERSFVPGDRRANALAPTATGQKLYQTALQAIAAHEDIILSGLSATDRATLNQLLHQIHALKS